MLIVLDYSKTNNQQLLILCRCQPENKFGPFNISLNCCRWNGLYFLQMLINLYCVKRKENMKIFDPRFTPKSKENARKKNTIFLDWEIISMIYNNRMHNIHIGLTVVTMWQDPLLILYYLAYFMLYSYSGENLGFINKICIAVIQNWKP